MPAISSIKEKLNQDLKAALLGGDKQRAEVLRGLKSTILYAEVATGNREGNRQSDGSGGEGGLDDTAIMALLAREAKKRQESADLYDRGGAQDKASKELAEKAIIETYLPERLGEDELTGMIIQTAAEIGASAPADMGRLIGAVKAQAGAAADGALVARLTQEYLAGGDTAKPSDGKSQGDAE